jgi:hypothetical protein
MLARAPGQALRWLGENLDHPAAVAQPLGRVRVAGVGGQHVRDQRGALHRLEQPQGALLAARHRRLGQER